jgi:hypothetical protein
MVKSSLYLRFFREFTPTARLDFVVAKPGGNCFVAESHIAYSAESELCISRTAQSQRKSISTVRRAATSLFLFF